MTFYAAIFTPFNNSFLCEYSAFHRTLLNLIFWCLLHLKKKSSQGDQLLGLDLFLVSAVLKWRIERFYSSFTELDASLMWNTFPIDTVPIYETVWDTGKFSCFCHLYGLIPVPLDR